MEITLALGSVYYDRRTEDLVRVTGIFEVNEVSDRIGVGVRL